LANHGTVSWGENVERAYWWTEILDSYCRILLLAKQIGHVEYLPPDKSAELVELKKQWGFTDPRHEADFKDCDIRANDVVRGTWQDSRENRGAFGAPANSAASGDAGLNVEDLVQTITDRVLAALQAPA
jgi:L-fuculose-phosphate aldolase